MRNIIQGQFKEQIPPTGTFLYVDVRDVAVAHVRAIEVAEAGGKRFFVTAGFFSNKEIVDAVRKTHPELTSKLPAEDTPGDFPSNIYEIDNSRSKKILGIKYRPFPETVADTIRSLQEVGA